MGQWGCFYNFYFITFLLIVYPIFYLINKYNYILIFCSVTDSYKNMLELIIFICVVINASFYGLGIVLFDILLA